MNKPKAIFCWSGGKDSAYCLHKVLEANEYEVCYLLTTLNSDFKRISMHGIREELLDSQAKSIGIELIKTWVSEGSNEEYETQMSNIFAKAKLDGIDYVIFGDIFLDDLRAYRESQLLKANMKGVFPLWKLNTDDIIIDFIKNDFKTIICCVNDGYLGEEFLATEIDSDYIKNKPNNIDACGENGEYHSFCYDGPIFKTKIDFKIGDKVYKPVETNTEHSFVTKSNTKGFWFCDLIPMN